MENRYGSIDLIIILLSSDKNMTVWFGNSKQTCLWVQEETVVDLLLT